jgi:putative ABC transport system substrate-binding protein
MVNPPSTPLISEFYRSIEAAGSKLAVETVLVPVHEPADFEPLIAELGRKPDRGLLVAPGAFLSLHNKAIVELATRHRVPAVYPFRFYTAVGGLVSYGPDLDDQFRRAAEYVDRILRGEKPAQLPVQQPINFELAINLKTARALGLDVPPMMLARADEVFE